MIQPSKKTYTHKQGSAFFITNGKIQDITKNEPSLGQVGKTLKITYLNIWSQTGMYKCASVFVCSTRSPHMISLSDLVLYKITAHEDHLFVHDQHCSLHDHLVEVSVSVCVIQ